ncbi:prephenate dehydrogenase/arogenate dehydrogenase family protein [Candidatus Nardonella dryophthoridicola]|uniref:prephenate dehydrogenase/arogenate dehydrogenase family protein n=1 Tax=Candidatus Nardonella dryophthoridicola TaxID=1971485 RepID=UPI003B973959
MIKSNIIIISVPISKFIFIFNKIININIHDKDCILIDISSIKNYNINYINKKYNGPFLSLHPMFNGKNDNIIKQTILYIEGKHNNKYK